MSPRGQRVAGANTSATSGFHGLYAKAEALGARAEEPPPTKDGRWVPSSEIGPHTSSAMRLQARRYRRSRPGHKPAGCRAELKDERGDLHAVVGGRLAGPMRTPGHHDHAQLGNAPLGERVGVSESAWYCPRRRHDETFCCIARPAGRTGSSPGQVSGVAVPCLRLQRPGMKMAAG
jgi:hypothetical protein